MNFLEAVTELAAGRCKRIIRKDSEVSYSMWPGTAPTRFQDILANDWELVDLVPEFEEVEISRYYCTGCGRVYAYDEEDGCKAPLIKLTGTYRKPVKRKVKRRERVDIDERHNGSVVVFHSAFGSPPKGAKLFAEWEE